MKKSVYSLVLSEEVVAAADAAAYRQGLSRSAFINRVLAEYLSYTTPEMQMQEIFGALCELLSQTAILPGDSTDSVLSLRSSLSYKYNPTVRYSLALTGKSDPLGELRVSLRTQSIGLLRILEEFYSTFFRVEQALIGETEVHLADGRLHRVLRLRARRDENGRATAEELGAAIADYVRCFDTALKTYFRYADQPRAATAAVEKLYREYLGTARDII